MQRLYTGYLDSGVKIWNGDESLAVIDNPLGVLDVCDHGQSVCSIEKMFDSSPRSRWVSQTKLEGSISTAWDVNRSISFNFKVNLRGK